MSESRAERHPHQPPPVTVPPSQVTATTDTNDRGSRPGLTPVTLVLSLLVAYLLLEIQLLLVLLMLAVLFATLIDRPVTLLQERHLPRPLSILLVYITIFAGIGLFSVSVAPAIREQAAIFREQAPGQIQELEQTWQESPNPILSGVGRDVLLRAIDFIDQPPSDVTVPEGAADVVIGFATGIGGGVIGLLTTLVIAFYYLMEKKWLRQIVLEQLKPSNRDHVSQIIDSVESKVGDWMRGQLVLMLVIGACATVGYGVLGVRFWPLLGIWAGLTEIIPIVGPWLGGIPAVIIALTQGWDKAIIVIGFIVLLQSFENYILVPRVMRGAVGLSPMTVFLAILAGTQFLGIMGAVLAIPVAAAVQVLLSDYFKTRREKYLAEARSVANSWQWMRGQRVVTPDGGVSPVAGTTAASGDPQSPAVSRSQARRRNGNQPHISRPPKHDPDE